MNLTIEIIDTPQWDGGESTPGPWVRVTSSDPFCDYECCTEGDECAAALGGKIIRLLTGGGR
jgi:hypothetical protein